MAYLWGRTGASGHQMGPQSPDRGTMYVHLGAIGKAFGRLLVTFYGFVGFCRVTAPLQPNLIFSGLGTIIQTQCGALESKR